MTGHKSRIYGISIYAKPTAITGFTHQAPVGLNHQTFLASGHENNRESYRCALQHPFVVSRLTDRRKPLPPSTHIQPIGALPQGATLLDLPILASGRLLR